MVNIAMVTDFYYPPTGGIETHIRYISTCLINLGHRVIVITHKHDNMKELVEYERIKVYALNFPVVALNTTFPSLYPNFYVYKTIFEMEKIDIVHGHQSMSNMCVEALFHACTLNIKTVLTEHSLFEKGPIENVIVNSLTRFALKQVNKFICVSNTSKVNLIDRLEIDPRKVVVIPNGVLHEKFYPAYNKNKTTKNVLVMSRFVYRKGIDLLVKAIPLICARDADIKIFIVGDGFKKDEIAQVIDENKLDQRVFLLGNINHDKVGDFLRTGDIFVNTSLTETFCMAILEAAMCSLHVVSTNVGGVHEVLPSELITFCMLDPEDLAIKVVRRLNDRDLQPKTKCLNLLKNKYMWSTIGEKTQEVYDSIKPPGNTIASRFIQCKNVFEQFLMVLEYLWLYVIEMF